MVPSAKPETELPKSSSYSGASNTATVSRSTENVSGSVPSPRQYSRMRPSFSAAVIRLASGQRS